MYRVKLIVHPTGKTDVILQASKDEEESLQALGFYLLVQREIEKFRRNVETLLQK